jgi:hypothetical protein
MRQLSWATVVRDRPAMRAQPAPTSRKDCAATRCKSTQINPESQLCHSLPILAKSHFRGVSVHVMKVAQFELVPEELPNVFFAVFCQCLPTEFLRAGKVARSSHRRHSSRPHSVNENRNPG